MRRWKQSPAENRTDKITCSRTRLTPRGKSHPINGDRKSTRLNSSHLVISYAVFCLKKKKKSTRRFQLCHGVRRLRRAVPLEDLRAAASGDPERADVVHRRDRDPVHAASVLCRRRL